MKKRDDDLMVGTFLNIFFTMMTLSYVSLTNDNWRLFYLLRLKMTSTRGDSESNVS